MKLIVNQQTTGFGLDHQPMAALDASGCQPALQPLGKQTT
jgi:hypothetical protein